MNTGLDDLLKGTQSGFPGRRAQFTFHLIEQRAAFIMSQSRHALEIFLNREAIRAASPYTLEKWQFDGQVENAPLPTPTNI